MDSRDIYLIEQSLEELGNTDETLLAERLSKFFQRVCNAVNLSYDEQENADPRDGCDLLFRRKYSQAKKDFISVCLLRLLCRNEEAIWEHEEFRKKTFSLFDEQINLIYAQFNITQNDQNHKKLERLLGTEEAVLTNFRNFTDSMVSLDTILGIRQKFMNTLNSNLNMLFLKQFVTPSSLINSDRINQIFDTASSYQESPMEDRVSAFQDVKDAFDPFLDDVGKYPSIFTKHCIFSPIQKIYDYIRKDFENNDATKPTSVIISELDRKYPLHEKNRKLDFKFQVTNSGPGYAFDIQINCECSEGLEPCNPLNLGKLGPNRSSVRVIQTAVKTVVEKSYEVLLTISWWNFDRSKRKSELFLFELHPQPADIDWDVLRKTKPYSLEPVNRAEDLVGREGLVAQLAAKLSADRIESSFIHGQKRVGKTSIAEVVQANFKNDANYSVALIQTTGLDTTNPQSFIAPLGRRVVRLVSRDSKSIKVGIAEPRFEGALSPLIEYLEEARDILPNHRFIIILDEFDEIPSEMVQVGNNAGQTFFNNIRAISSTGYVGFVLVGGENMQIILESTDQFNKMTSFRVDYFDKETDWDEFQELVRRPVNGTIEFNEEAINALYEMTEGHPFYTKAICSKIFTVACEDRNAYISEDNVQEAIQDTIKSLDLNSVSHFWIDGISKRHVPATRDEIQTHRRRFLIAFAQIKRRYKFVEKQNLRDSELLRNLDVDKIVDQYITRGFLIEGEKTGHLRWRPRFFERWLIERGFSMLTSEFLDEEAIIRLKEQEDKAFVTDSEIVELQKNFQLYQGKEVTPVNVRAWLNQFEYDNTEQRLMFNILQHVKFYGEPLIREKMQGLHQNVQQDIARRGVARPASRRARRTDILLSSFGPPSKSGSSYARLYANENKIAYASEISFADIPPTLNSNDHVEAIVFVDDIIASGDSTIEYLSELNEKCGELLKEKQVKVFISAICGLYIGIEKLKNAIEKVPFEAEVFVSDDLTKTNQCFSDESEIFPSPQDREKAKGIALEIGKQIEKKIPLGFQDNQLLVVYYDNCPNNTLPILWKESTGKIKWTPLFKRN